MSIESASSSPPPPQQPSARRRRSALYVVQLISGCLLLTAWIIWWIESFGAGMLLKLEWTWVPGRISLGFDFLHNYLGVRDWLAGNNPYTHLWGDPMGIPYNYAPIVLGLFAWCGWVDLVPAVIGWACAVAVIVAVATWYAVRVRARLGIRPIPSIFAIAVMLLATPTMFSMERGNCDALSLLALLGAVVALNKRSRAGDAVAGVCLALATLIKIYPALAIFGLLPLRRIRPFIFASIAGLLISAATPTATVQWLHNIHTDAATYNVLLVTHTHTISGCWKYLFDYPLLRPLLHVPPVLGTGILLLPLFALTGIAMNRSARRDLLTFPYLLWLTQAGTFWSPVSFDYKLLFLPLAMICLWDRRAPWYAHVLLALFTLYLQPIRIPALSPLVLLIFKFAGLVGGAILVHRAANQRTTPSISGPA